MANGETFSVSAVPQLFLNPMLSLCCIFHNTGFFAEVRRLEVLNVHMLTVFCSCMYVQERIERWPGIVYGEGKHNTALGEGGKMLYLPSF